MFHLRVPILLTSLAVHVQLCGKEQLVSHTKSSTTLVAADSSNIFTTELEGCVYSRAGHVECQWDTCLTLKHIRLLTHRTGRVNSVAKCAWRHNSF